MLISVNWKSDIGYIFIDHNYAAEMCLIVSKPESTTNALC